MLKTESSMKNFDCPVSAAVRKFIFFFDNVIMRGNHDEDMATERLPHLDGKDFVLFYELLAEKRRPQVIGIKVQCC